jgi:hypothetical protein
LSKPISKKVPRGRSHYAVAPISSDPRRRESERQLVDCLRRLDRILHCRNRWVAHRLQACSQDIGQRPRILETDSERNDYSFAVATLQEAVGGLQVLCELIRDESSLNHEYQLVTALASLLESSLDLLPSKKKLLLPLPPPADLAELKTVALKFQEISNVAYELLKAATSKRALTDDEITSVHESTNIRLGKLFPYNELPLKYLDISEVATEYLVDVEEAAKDTADTIRLDKLVDGIRNAFRAGNAAGCPDVWLDDQEISRIFGYRNRSSCSNWRAEDKEGFPLGTEIEKRLHFSSRRFVEWLLNDDNKIRRKIIISQLDAIEGRGRLAEGSAIVKKIREVEKKAPR